MEMEMRVVGPAWGEGVGKGLSAELAPNAIEPNLIEQELLTSRRSFLMLEPPRPMMAPASCDTANRQLVNG